MTSLRVIAAILISIAYGTAQAPPTFTTLYSLAGGSYGSLPATVVVGSGGVLYGTTPYGGANNQGTVFALTPPALPGGAWAETSLHSFGGTGDGTNPDSRLTIGAGGVIYGVTDFGGTSNFGTVFSLTPPSSPGGQWTEDALHSFGKIDGHCPYGALSISTEGILYGTTSQKGSQNSGTVFEVVPPAAAGGVWTEAVLYSFGGGASPESGVVIGPGRTLYGTTPSNGSWDAGTVFALTPPETAGGAWTETVLYSFAGGTDGSVPNSCPVIGSGGVLYGTTTLGGDSNGGTIFSLTPPPSPDGAWTEAVLHSFQSAPSSVPDVEPVALGEGGALLGSTFAGGASLLGDIFVLKPPISPGGSWTYRRLYTFTGDYGYHPLNFVVRSGGVLYGITALGGAYGSGTVFELTL